MPTLLIQVVGVFILPSLGGIPSVGHKVSPLLDDCCCLRPQSFVYNYLKFSDTFLLAAFLSSPSKDFYLCPELRC